MELMKRIGKSFSTFFRRKSTPSSENNDMVELRSDNSSPELENEYISTNQDHVRDVNDICIILNKRIDYGMVELGSDNCSPELKIKHIFPNQDHVRGVNDICIILNERIDHDDIQVRFFEEVNGKIVWETFTYVRHRQFLYVPPRWYLKPPDTVLSAVLVRCPSYRSFKINEPVTVYIQVLRLSDGAVTSAKPFRYLPPISDLEIVCYMSVKPLAHGNHRVTLAFSQRVDGKDIQVRFFEAVNGRIVWEKLAIIEYYGIYSPQLDVICPSYKSLEIDVPVKTYIQCMRLSDGAKSNHVAFNFHPLKSGEPLPLTRLCRRVIRLCMGDYEVEKRIDCLELPQEMKVFLLHRT